MHSALLTLALLAPSQAALVARPRPSIARPFIVRPSVARLRGGVSLPEAALYCNGGLAAIYSVLMVFATNTLLSTYGIDDQDFLSPAVGAFQYLGGLYSMVALRAYAALTGVRDQRQTLEAMIYTNGVMASIAAYRIAQGSLPSQKNLVIFTALCALSCVGWSKA